MRRRWFAQVLAVVLTVTLVGLVALACGCKGGDKKAEGFGKGKKDEAPPIQTGAGMEKGAPPESGAKAGGAK